MDDIYLVIEPQVTDIYLVLEESSGGGSGGLSVSDIVMGEVPAGLVNGSNASFTSAFPFTPGKLIVELNGVTQKIVDDYITVGNSTINLNFSPTLGEKILINYIKL